MLITLNYFKKYQKLFRQNYGWHYHCIQAVVNDLSKFIKNVCGRKHCVLGHLTIIRNFLFFRDCVFFSVNSGLSVNFFTALICF